MKYQQRSNQLPYFSGNSNIDEFSFVKNHSVIQKADTMRLQSRQNSGQLSYSDNTRSIQNKFRQSLHTRPTFLTEDLLHQCEKSYRQSAHDRKNAESNIQHLYQRQSTVATYHPLSEVLKYEPLQDTGDQIYQEIIRVLQIENTNLKGQNQYFIQQHKRILKQNSKLKAEVQELRSLNGLQIEVQKLKDINQAYQSQIEELKFILLQEIVTIHQKFNMYMSEQQASLIYNELNDSIKLSASLINTDRLTIADKMQTNNEITPNIRTNQGLLLADMLDINQSDIFQKSPGKTAQTLDKQHIMNGSNFDLKFMQSPTETTFSGQLRISN